MSLRRCALVVLAFLAIPFPVGAQVIAIRAGKLVDPDSGTVAVNQVILVEAGKIKAVGAGLAIPAGAPGVDPSSPTVMPRPIDAHTHLCLPPGPLRRAGVPAA